MGADRGGYGWPSATPTLRTLVEPAVALGDAFVVIVAAVLGFGGFAANFAWLAKIAFGVFLVIAIIALISGRRVVA